MYKQLTGLIFVVLMFSISLVDGMKRPMFSNPELETLSYKKQKTNDLNMITNFRGSPTILSNPKVRPDIVVESSDTMQRVFLKPVIQSEMGSIESPYLAHVVSSAPAVHIYGPELHFHFLQIFDSGSNVKPAQAVCNKPKNDQKINEAEVITAQKVGVTRYLCRQYQCGYENCKYLHGKKNCIEKHREMHNDARAVKCEYEECYFLANDDRSMNRHIKSHGPANFICEKCHKGFKHKDSLERHSHSRHFIKKS